MNKLSQTKRLAYYRHNMPTDQGQFILTLDKQTSTKINSGLLLLQYAPHFKKLIYMPQYDGGVCRDVFSSAGVLLLFSHHVSET